MRSFGRVAIGMILMLSLRVGPLFSQGSSAALSGKVADPSGLAIVGATVQVLNVNTNITYPTTTNQVGIYSLTALPPGPYRIVVEKEGFDRIVRPDVDLHVADKASIDFALRVGSVTQTVTVEGGAPLVNTTNGSLGGLVQSNEVAELPLNGRNYIDLTLMQPGVAPVNLTKGGSVNGTWFSSSGAGIRENNFLLDGAIMQEVNGGSTASFSGRTLGVEGIEEYRVITNNFSAEYGVTMGSQTIMVSKAGTNQFHGSAFEYLRNSALDAKNYFDRGVAANNFQRLPAYRRNDFGAAFGGPIIKNKTFFFATFEELKERLGITVNNTVPGAGCHGAADAVITNTACPQLGATASVKVAPVVAPLLALYPLPNLPNNGFTTPYTQPDTDVFGQIRVDHVFSEKDSLFLRYTIDDDDQVLGLTYPHLFVNPRLTRHQYATLAENHIFSPSLLNSFRFSYSRTISNRTSPNPFIGPQYSLVAGEEMGPITIGGIASTFGPIANPPATQTQQILTLSDEIGYTRGSHTLKFGTMINSWRQYGLQTMRKQGIANFSNLASFLAGNASAFQAILPPAVFDRTVQFYTLGVYIQDDWRLRSNFTLNAGLRYEPSPNYYSEVHGISASIINPLTDSEQTVGPFFQNPTLHDFSPRLGFAWDVWGNGKTSVRGGASLLWDTSGSLYQAVYNVIPAESPFTKQFTGSGLITLPLTFSGSTSSQATIQYGLKQARLYSESLTVEQQLPFTIALSLSYVGTRGLHIGGPAEANPSLPQTITNGIPVWNPNPAQGIPKTNPMFSNVTSYDSRADSSYNALQVQLRKRMTHGLQFQTSFTWSKLLDNGQGTGTVDSPNSSNVPTNPYNSRFDRGPAPYSIPKIWVSNFIYSLPSPKIQARILAGLASGWGITGIYTQRDGFPFNPRDSAQRSRSGVLGGATAGIDRPNYNPAFTGPIITGDPNQWFNPAAFMLQPVGTLGNVGRNSLLGPSYTGLDFAVKKETKLGFLGEAGLLTFRAEFFNLLNHPNFAMPSTNVFAGALTDPVTVAPLSNAGQINDTQGTSRQVEFGLRLSF